VVRCNMDVNLTGQIAANLAENLKQPWYNPLINASAGVIGGIVTGLFTLIGVWMTLKYYERQNERNRKYDVRRSRREELKKVYIDFLVSIEKMNANPNEIDVDDLTKSLNAVLLLGDADIGNKTGKIFMERLGRLTDPQVRRELVDSIYGEIAPLMMQKLDDLQEPVDGLYAT